MGGRRLGGLGGLRRSLEERKCGILGKLEVGCLGCQRGGGGLKNKDGKGGEVEVDGGGLFRGLGVGLRVGCLGV